MKFYAQLNEQNICIGISQLADTINDEKMIEIDSFDVSKIWHKYENSEWSVESFEPVPTTPQPTEFQKLELAIQMQDFRLDLMDYKISSGGAN